MRSLRWLCWLPLAVVSAEPVAGPLAENEWSENELNDVLGQNVSHASLCREGGCWPATWILGGQKCGSTSVWSWLTRNHNVCGAVVPPKKPAWFEKETHFWDSDWVSHVSHLAPADAARQFTALYPASKLKECPNGFHEATPANFRSAEAPRLLRAALPAPFRSELRFIAVLREPIARDLSAYNHQAQLGVSWCSVCRNATYATYETYARCRLETKTTKTSCMQGLDVGFYEAQLRRWATAFSRRQILVLEFGWLIANEADAGRRIAAFLRFPALRAAATFPHSNAAVDNSKAPPQTTIRCHIRDRLEAVYEPENEKLYAHLAATRGPAEEPPFPRFERMPCVGESRTNTHE